MATKSFKQIMYILFFLLGISIVSAISIQDLINSYDFSIDIGIISITNSSDTMIDTNNNSINDTLQITLNISGVAGTYNLMAGG